LSRNFKIDKEECDVFLSTGFVTLYKKVHLLFILGWRCSDVINKRWRKQISRTQAASRFQYSVSFPWSRSATDVRSKFRRKWNDN